MTLDDIEKLVQMELARGVPVLVTGDAPRFPHQLNRYQRVPVVGEYVWVKDKQAKDGKRRTRVVEVEHEPTWSTSPTYIKVKG